MSSRSKLTSLNVSNTLTCVLQQAQQLRIGGMEALATRTHMRIATALLSVSKIPAVLATRTHMRIATDYERSILLGHQLATRTHMRIATAKMHNTTTRSS